MSLQIKPVVQSLPAVSGITDPAVRRFAQAVQDAIQALRSEEGAVESLKKAAEVLAAGGAGATPPSVAQWLFSSELYRALTAEIERVDAQAKLDLLNEAMTRSDAIAEVQAALANIENTAEYNPATAYETGDLVTFGGKLYRANQATTGNDPTNLAYWTKVGDYGSLGEVVAAHTIQINDTMAGVALTNGNLQSEISARQALGAQLRGTYTGTDITQVTQGLIFAERTARANADGALTTSLDALTARTGNTETAIIEEETLRASNDLAIVTAVNTALARITGVSSSISQSGENLIANWTTAQATKWSQIESEVLTAGGQTIRAALQTEASTRASQTGQLYGQYTVKVDLDGYVTGFGLASTANNGTPTSSFIIRADKFAVVMPGYAEHVPFAIGPSGASFNGFTDWSKVTGSGKPANNATVGADWNTNLANRPTNAQLLNNLLDPSKWYNGAWGTTLSGFGFTMNGGHWENYCTISDLPDGSRGTVWQAIAGRYLGEARNPVPVAPGDADGGWNTTSFPVDSLKPYRFSVWVKHVSGSGNIYSGVGGNTVRNMGSDYTANSNPYFVVHSKVNLVANQWYLIVGYVHPRNYGTGGQTSRSGIYHGSTGAKIANGTDYVWLDASIASSIQRVYQYYASQDAQTLFAWPRVDEINGSEPSLDQLLAMAVVNARNPITPTNVTTYIANAAIQNAQIGDVIQSGNYAPGAAGWHINKSGYAEFQNAVFRGKVTGSVIEGSTLITSSLVRYTDAGNPWFTYYNSTMIQTGGGGWIHTYQGGKDNADREVQSLTEVLNIYPYNAGPSGSGNLNHFKGSWAVINVDSYWSTGVVSRGTEFYAWIYLTDEAGNNIEQLFYRDYRSGGLGVYTQNGLKISGLYSEATYNADGVLTSPSYLYGLTISGAIQRTWYSGNWGSRRFRLRVIYRTWRGSPTAGTGYTRLSALNHSLSS